ncbi:transglycosylase domain-containing protein [Pseudonocardia sp. Ae505_Ps2]|uniref:transglycosylase domain-containing protein n=1 Tax=Pseudonocardia sp. Ae505_Ps2 TaxID=1885034 RepID=UPI00095EF0F9|nr:transglycosylase domain-containing protein [Pseudonocardia sp. Ae505_Ps2]OLM10941.1 Monofunctional biosynthetic peptidoglycan transglycosylase [Pseudonocardia sp. Ae505_Ps2]
MDADRRRDEASQAPEVLHPAQRPLPSRRGVRRSGPPPRRGAAVPEPRPEVGRPSRRPIGPQVAALRERLRRLRPQRPPGTPPQSTRVRLRRVLRWALVAQTVPLVLVLLFTLVNPPYTMFRLWNFGPTVAQWTDAEHVSRNFLVVVMGQEDQQFPERTLAVDYGMQWARVQAYLDGTDDPSGSTITQQTSKNLFLWAGRYPPLEPLRKALEIPPAETMEIVMSKRRILEIYVNVAQFAPRVYGVCAASWYYFGKSSRSLSVDESAQLVGLLPSPLHVECAPGGGMRFLGDANGNGVADPGERGWISAKGYWHARERAPRWYAQMGGLAATEGIGIAGNASDLPAADDPCREPPAALADLD